MVDGSLHSDPHLYVLPRRHYYYSHGVLLNCRLNPRLFWLIMFFFLSLSFSFFFFFFFFSSFSSSIFFFSSLFSPAPFSSFSFSVFNMNCHLLVLFFFVFFPTSSSSSSSSSWPTDAPNHVSELSFRINGSLWTDSNLRNCRLCLFVH